MSSSKVQVTPNHPMLMRVPGMGAAIQLPSEQPGAAPIIIHLPLEGGTIDLPDGRRITFTPTGTPLPPVAKPVVLVDEAVSQKHGISVTNLSTRGGNENTDSEMMDVDNFDEDESINTETYSDVPLKDQRILQWRKMVVPGELNAPYPAFKDQRTPMEDGLTAFDSARDWDDKTSYDTDESMTDAEESVDEDEDLNDRSQGDYDESASDDDEADDRNSASDHMDEAGNSVSNVVDDASSSSASSTVSRNVPGKVAEENSADNENSSSSPSLQKTSASEASESKPEVAPIRKTWKNVKRRHSGQIATSTSNPNPTKSERLLPAYPGPWTGPGVPPVRRYSGPWAFPGSPLSVASTSDISDTSDSAAEESVHSSSPGVVDSSDSEYVEHSNTASAERSDSESADSESAKPSDSSSEEPVRVSAPESVDSSDSESEESVYLPAPESVEHSEYEPDEDEEEDDD